MQSSLAEKQDAEAVPVVPPVPIKTYQWEEVKRAKLQGAYPWTHILKEPLEGEEITAETILRDTSPRMSRDNSRERSGGRTPDLSTKDEPQKILKLDSSPGSSRKLDGEEETVHVPNFSKEISLDSEEDILEKNGNTAVRAVTPEVLNLTKETKVSLSPKGILKRKLPERVRPVSEESPRNSKCCHPFVEKIKHIADKTIHKAEKRSPKRGIQKKKIFVDKQEILILDNSPGSERRERIKIANEKEEIASDKKISLVMEKEEENVGKSLDTEAFEIKILDSSPSSKKRREHIYEDIESGNKLLNQDSLENPASDVSEAHIDNQSETKSGDSKDPSLFFDEPMDEESVSESVNHVKAMYDISMTPDKLVADIQCNNVIIIEPIETASPNACKDDVIVSEVERQNESPNITITEVTEDELSDRHLNLDDMDVCAQDRRVHFDMSDTNNKSDPEEETSPEDGKDNLWSKIRTVANKCKRGEFSCGEQGAKCRVVSGNGQFSVLSRCWREFNPMRRWTSEGGTPGRSPLYPSREGSIPAASREVRCGCQYFQSDSLLPERYNPIGSRPTSPVHTVDNNSLLSDYSHPISHLENLVSSEVRQKPFDNNLTLINNIPTTKVYNDPHRGFQSTYISRSRPASAYAHLQSDHEYEPVGKPPVETCDATNNNSGAMSVSVIGVAGETSVGGTNDEDPEWLADDASSTTSHERQFLHPANEEDNEAFSGTENEADASNVASHKKEAEYFVNTPTTTESRTDCEISTSQVDSSAIEDLPLKRDSRKKSTVAQETAKLRQRLSNQTGKIKTHAGKIKTRLKTIKKPQFNMPERPKFNLPERPKFNLPNRPKFSLPERPKINLPERPKFKMPERPKINLPERPKINFPERPKFSLPERPKFNFPERPKINFPERPKFSLPDRSKFKLPDRPKLNFSSFNRSKENRSSIEDTVTTEPSVSSKKNFLDFDFRTYPRIFNKNKKKKDISGERPGTPPPPGFATVPRATKDRKQIVASQWEHASSRTTDDEPRHYGIDYSYDKEPDFQTKLAQVDKDYREMQQEVEGDNNNIDTPVRATLENKEIWNAIERNTVQQLEHRSSLPFIPTNDNTDMFDDPQLCDDDESSAASTGQHRRGVLEEINNDEFFLRQKGISQDNIEVGKYLSNEIRDAFRSPINALNQIDKDNKSLGSSNVQMDMDDNELMNSRYKEDSEEQICQDEEEINQNNLMAENDDGYYTFPPVRPSRAKKLKTLVQELPKEKIAIAHDENEEEFAHVHLQTIPTPSIFTDKRVEPESNLENFQKRVFGNTFKEPEILENLNEYENEMEQTKEVPTIPKRRRRNLADRNYSESESLLNDNIETQEWAQTEMSEMKNASNDQIILHQIESTAPMSNNIAGTPIAPRRSRSRGSRTTSVGDDDRTSRGAESLTLDSHVQMNTADLDYMDDMDDGPGYAIVDKTIQPKEEEMPPPRPPPPMRKHRSAKSLSGDRQFFTVPRSIKDSSPPRRPSRTYSTLGPSRPPRKKSTTSLSGLESLQKTSSSGDVTQYVEIEDDDADSHKNLKSGEVVSKMKDRPLPPPPRPPRGPKKKKESNNVDNVNSGITENLKSDMEMELSTDPTITTDLEINNIISADTNNNISGLQDANSPAEIETRRHTAYEIADQEQVVEIEVSTQTDPLPDDFDYDLGIDEPLSETFDLRSSYNDLTKEEAEENSIDVELMTKGLQKFRESSRPSSRTSKLKSPTDRPKTPLGRMSPTAILVERRVSSPTRINERDEIVTEASLTVQPIDEPVIIEQQSFAPVHKYYPTASEVLHSMNVPHHIPDHSVQQSEHLKTTDDGTKRDVSMTSHEAGPIDQEIQAISLPDTTPQTSNQIVQQLNISDLEVLKTQRLQVADLDVERLSVSELQASKILVSDIEGLSLNVNDVNSKSGHIFVRGIELAPGVIEELLERFAQMVPPSTSSTAREASTQDGPVHSQIKPDINQETQTDEMENRLVGIEIQAQNSQNQVVNEVPVQGETTEPIPCRPPPPSMHSSMFQPIPYYPEFSLPSSSYYRHRASGDRRQDGASGDAPPPPSRSRKHRRELSLSSSEDEDYKPMSRRIPSSHRAPEASEASVSELSIQLLRACQNSVSRTIQHIVSYIKKHFGDGQSKKEVEMAVVIFLVMAAGLIMLSLGDGRTVHHHHWDFINPPDTGKH